MYILYTLIRNLLGVFTFPFITFFLYVKEYVFPNTKAFYSFS